MPFGTDRLEKQLPGVYPCGQQSDAVTGKGQPCLGVGSLWPAPPNPGPVEPPEARDSEARTVSLGLSLLEFLLLQQAFFSSTTWFGEREDETLTNLAFFSSAPLARC